MENYNTSSEKRGIILLVILSVIYVTMCMSLYQHERVTGDASIFFDIAEKYSAGDYKNAVNGFWGPLLSWILVPFVHFKIDKFFTMNLLSAVIGVFTLIGIRRLSFRFKMSDIARSAALLCALPITLQASLIETQDFLLLCLLIYYLSYMLKSDYELRVSNAIYAGAIGAFAYFCKSYAFPFFVSHFIAANILHYFRATPSDGKRKVIRNVCAGLLVFALLTSIWIIQVSTKYGHFAFSTTGKNNMAAMGPEAEGEDSNNPIYGREQGWPIFYQGLLEPVNETATSIWEDPTYLEMKPWSPMESAAHFKHFINLLLKNTSQGIQILNLYSSLAFAIIFAYILLCIRPLRSLLARTDLTLPLLTIALYTAGYTLVHQEVRYLQLVNVLMLLMGGHILHRLFKTDFFDSAFRKKALITLLALTFIIMPVRYILKKGHSIEALYELSQDLRNQYNIKGRIASNKEHIGSNEAWHTTFRLAYHLDSQYYGQVRDRISNSELEDVLLKHNIDYYFIWGENQRIPEFLQQKVEVTQGRIPGLKIYHVQ